MKLALILAILWLNEATSKEMRARNRAKIKASKPKNMCDFEPADNNNIRCFCTKEKYQTITSAECWFFGQVARDNPIWTLIVESQPYLGDFKIVANNQGQIKSIPLDFLQRMVYLKNLTVSYAMMDRLERYAFGNSSSLESLKLTKNQIGHLEPFAIAYLPSLKELDLEENRLRTIGTSTFFYVPQLKFVRLNNNNITKVENEAFAALSGVLEMDLSENYICDISTDTFFGLSKLKVIDLSVNRIISLPTSVFSEMWDVEDALENIFNAASLEPKSNGLRLALSAHEFLCFLLRELNKDSNRIPDLENLNVMKIDEFSSSCRKAGLNCSIICMYCTGNSCENIANMLIDSDDEDPDDIILLPTFDVIDEDSGEDESDAENTYKTSEVYLDDNYIEFISNRAFDGLRFLKTISLRNNRLTRFPAGLLTSVFTLVNLDVSNNRLETLLFDSIEQFYNNLIHNGTMQLKGMLQPIIDRSCEHK
ncbi:unnamed protein product [Phaedon cochleariae]|uniref:Uncharacterized protein n=1 Tax=Phaedon cochleariae TaxID=80249 RepID=A0A9N9SGU0_PHACE|nr:unnamed protein product [Phaedon cochleariae]